MCPQDRDNMTRIRVAGEKHTAVVSRSVVNAFYSKHITLCCKQRTLHKTKKTYEVRSCICFTPHPRHILHTGGCPRLAVFPLRKDLNKINTFCFDKCQTSDGWVWSNALSLLFKIYISRGGHPHIPWSNGLSTFKGCWFDIFQKKIFLRLP